MKLQKAVLAHWGYPHLLYLPLYVALHSGRFKKEGLDVQISYGPNDDDIFKLVSKKKVDFGISDPLFSLQNPNVQCAGIVVNRIGIWGITHNPVIPKIKRLEDFVGLRIGSLPDPSTTYSLIANLKNNSRRLLKSMKIVEAAIGKQSELLEKNKADVILELEPMVSLAESNGFRAVFSLADYYKDFAFTGITYSKSLSKEKPDLKEKFMSCIDWALTKSNHDESLALKVSKKVFEDYPDHVLKNAIRRLKKAKVWPETSEVQSTSWDAAKTVWENLYKNN